MEQDKNLQAQELTITNGTIFHFKRDDKSDETVIVEQKNDRVIILNLQSLSLNTIMHHPKHYELWDKLNMNWLYKDIAYPFLFITHESLQYILSHHIEDALSFSHYLLKEYSMHQYIDSHDFLTKVMQNKSIDTLDRLILSCQIIKVISDKASLKDLDKHFNEALNDKEKAKYIRKFADADIKIDINQPGHVLKNKWRNAEVYYVGNLDLPEQFVLLKSIDDFKSYTYYEDFDRYDLMYELMQKESFYIGLKKRENIHFIVQPQDAQSWFSFQVDYCPYPQKYKEEICALGYAMAKKGNQEFFKANYRNTNPLTIKANGSVYELYDNVL